MKFTYPLLAILILSACNNNPKKQSSEGQTNDTIEVKSDSLVKDTTLTDLTQIILTQIKNKNYQSLTEYIHPELGVRLSPYGYINTETDIVIKADQFNDLINKEEKMVWGAYDGTGEEIKLTPSEYFNRFIYDVNFLKAEKLTVNQSSAQGNSINNIKEVYPDAEYTESYFSGFDKKYGGMDWRALRLVYKKLAGKNYLVGIIHDEWTI